MSKNPELEVFDRQGQSWSRDVQIFQQSAIAAKDAAITRKSRDQLETLLVQSRW